MHIYFPSELSAYKNLLFLFFKFVHKKPVSVTHIFYIVYEIYLRAQKNIIRDWILSILASADASWICGDDDSNCSIRASSCRNDDGGDVSQEI